MTADSVFPEPPQPVKMIAQLREHLPRLKETRSRMHHLDSASRRATPLDEHLADVVLHLVDRIVWLEDRVQTLESETRLL